MHRCKVLVVDGNAAARQSMSRLLMARNYEPYFADDGVDALLKSYNLAPQAIIWAVDRPDYWGLECIAHIKVMQPRLPVIVFERGASSRLDYTAAADRIFSRRQNNLALLFSYLDERCMPTMQRRATA